MNVWLLSDSDGKKRAKVTEQLRAECFRKGLLQLSFPEGAEFRTGWAALLILCQQKY